MMCQMIGLPPISIIGLGRVSVSSVRRVPRPPARMTVFIVTAKSLRNALGTFHPHGHISQSRQSAERTCKR